MKPTLSLGSPNKEKKNILILWNSLIVFMVGLVFFAAGVLCLRSYLKDKQKVPTP